MFRSVRSRAAAVTLVLATALAAGPVLAAEPLTGEKIQQTVVGHTVHGTMSDGHSYTEFYAPGGVVMAETYTASWSIEGDQMCFDYPRADKSCFGVALDQGKVVWLDDGEAVGEGHVLPGNPYDF